MARVSLRDWIELLLEPGDSIERRDALVALAGVRAPLVAEAVQLALEMEGESPFAHALTEALATLDEALGPKAAALANDPTVAAFRTATSPYRPLGLLGSGTDSRTYLAVQVALRRLVALKLLPPRLADQPAARARLLGDARQLGRTLHPHVAGVLDAGEVGGQAFVASEMVDGQSLHQVLEQGGAIAWPVAVRLIREAVSALTATHRVGVTHGRLLTTTLLIDREERLKLTDFAPASGRNPGLSAARDVADLGLMFHELLSGVVLSRPLSGPVPPLVGDVPEPIARLVKRMVAPREDERLTDCAELCEILEEAVAAAGPGLDRASGGGRPAVSRGKRPPTGTAVLRPGTTIAARAHPPRNILVVDDEPNILERASLLLTPFDFEVSTALSPEDALRLIARNDFDVVLTDLNFPGRLSGVGLVRALRAHKDPVPLVAMSGSQDSDVWEQVLAAGVAGIVAKPLDTTELVAVIERAVSRHRPALLLVDDSHLARRVFKRFFENRGFAVTVVPGVQAAIEAVQAAVPAVVVSDLHLDDGTGVDVLQYLHDHHPDVHVIIMSAKPDADMVIQSHRLNVFDFVNKSEDPRYLLRSVERVVISHPLAAA